VSRRSVLVLDRPGPDSTVSVEKITGHSPIVASAAVLTMASDILTQLQTCYDQLLTQFFSTISYLSQRHPLVAPDPVLGDPYTQPPGTVVHSTQDSVGTHPSTQPAPIAPGAEDTERAPYPLRPVSPHTFAIAQHELADDLVQKGQQIETLISKLPGIGRGEDQQAEEIQQLVERVKQMEQVRREKRSEMRTYVRRLEQVLTGMATSIDYDTSPETPPSRKMNNDTDSRP